MIIKESDLIAKDIEIRREDDKVLSHVKEFDTKTKEAIVYVYLKYNDGSRIILQSDDNVDNNLYALSPDLSNRKMKVAEIKIKLPKHDAYNKKTGEKIV